MWLKPRAAQMFAGLFALIVDISVTVKRINEVCRTSIVITRHQMFFSWSYTLVQQLTHSISFPFLADSHFSERKREGGGGLPRGKKKKERVGWREGLVVMNRCGKRGSFSNPNYMEKEHKICRLDWTLHPTLEIFSAVRRQSTAGFSSWIRICNLPVWVNFSRVLARVLIFQ